MKSALRYTSAIVWFLAIGTGCFTVGLVTGRSAVEGGNYGIYVLVSTVVATAALVAAIFLTIAIANKPKQRRSRY